MKVFELTLISLFVGAISSMKIGASILLVVLSYNAYAKYSKGVKTPPKTTPQTPQKEAVKKEAPQQDFFSCAKCHQKLARKMEVEKNTCQPCYINK